MISVSVFFIISDIKVINISFKVKDDNLELKKAFFG